MRLWTRFRYALIVSAATVSLNATAAFPADLKPVAQVSGVYPEGAEWIRGALYFVEMYAERVMVFSEGEARVFWQGQNCGPTSISAFGDRFVVTCHLSDSLAILSPTGSLMEVLRIDNDGKPFNNPNDSYGDAQGGVYFTASGNFSTTASATGKILYIDAANEIHVCAQGIHYANGILIDNSKNRLLVSEHIGKRILSFHLTSACNLTDRREFSNARDWDSLLPIKPAYDLSGPDGLTVDKDGNHIIAYYGAGELIVLDSDGQFISHISVPFQFVTNVSVSPDEEYIAVTGSFINDRPPYDGETIILKKKDLY
ncbi:SMP-30/gluconolactonase/LRE family protein [Agrobacterium tumefaciens]|uniref:SMP-30/gluconolactonase/LRE family protein n=1 Tax=Agrobacterium tumefaciens TaxID=358 RepID=UPI00045B3BA0|nr:SMP-30/gluconolactonase/LRE family protein [Agrobacterium tumefaciens]CDN96483.1 Gluconolactonase [Agrobacterium tumefaciens]